MTLNSIPGLRSCKIQGFSHKGCVAFQTCVIQTENRVDKAPIIQSMVTISTKITLSDRHWKFQGKHMQGDLTKALTQARVFFYHHLVFFLSDPYIPKLRFQLPR